ncbi:MAG: SDR family NAD(P)-dependent oxidoreductase [Lachnospiraceae bacterium]|nr:SDR family NAD(P)-dependent oxidoreductase [Lachnospiraceae bacterium]
MKKALITGASRGIGAACAKRFAEEGYDLVITCDRSVDELENVAKSLHEEFGVTVNAIRCDVSDEASVQRLFKGLESLDVLVNNAGIAYFGLLHEMTFDEWKKVLGTNLDSAFLTSKMAIPLFLKNHSGAIINVSSVWGNVGASTEVAYSASKGGINAFTKALAKELAPSNITVNAVACGVIDTKMNAVLSDEDRSALMDEIPAGRFGSPDEVADLIFKIATSPTYMTGQIITIDGGWY